MTSNTATAVSAAQTDQQIVAHEEEDHLVQVLHRGGHACLQRGKGRDEPAPARQREAQRVLLTEKARQIDGDGDDLSQRGGQCRARDALSSASTSVMFSAMSQRLL